MVRSNQIVAKWTIVVLLTIFGVIGEANARSITLLGVRGQSGAEVRFLSRHAKSANHYWSLKLTEVTIGAKVHAKETTLVNRRTGFRRQKGGLFEAHRADIMKRERAEQDRATLDQYRAPTLLTCTESSVLTGVRPRFTSANDAPNHFATQCVLRETSGTAHAKVLMRVMKEETEVSVAIPAHGILKKVVTVPHLSLRLRHRGEVARPLERLHRAWVAFPDDPEGRFFILLWSYRTPDLPDVERQQVLTLVTKDPTTGAWRGQSF